MWLGLEKEVNKNILCILTSLTITHSSQYNFFIDIFVFNLHLNRHKSTQHSPLCLNNFIMHKASNKMHNQKTNHGDDFHIYKLCFNILTFMKSNKFVIDKKNKQENFSLLWKMHGRYSQLFSHKLQAHGDTSFSG